MSGQIFLEPVNDLPLALSFCIRTCSVPVRLHHDRVTDGGDTRQAPCHPGIKL